MAGALANRYAGALADVATGKTASAAGVTPEKITAELREFLAAFQASADLRNVLLSPAVTPDKKKAILAEIGQKLGFSRITENFLRVVTDHRRLALIEEMIEGFQTLLDERIGIARAEVAAARPVDAGQEAALASALEAVTGKQVRLHFTVDPALLGGIVARIGSTVYDGSVKGQLQVLGRRLATE